MPDPIVKLMARPGETKHRRVWKVIREMWPKKGHQGLLNRLLTAPSGSGRLQAADGQNWEWFMACPVPVPALQEIGLNRLLI